MRNGFRRIRSPSELHLAPDHGLRQCFDAGLCNGHFLHHPTTAHHGHLIAQSHHFFQLVGDQNHRRALRAQLPQHVEKLQRFLRRQHGGGLVQNQDARAAVQRFQNLQPLPITHRQIGDQSVQGDAKTGGLHQRLQPRAHRRCCLVQQPMRLGSEHHVVQRAQGVDQHEMLVHHANAEGNRVVRVVDFRFCAKHRHRAAVRRVKAVEHRHQRALARAVLAHDAVYGAGAYRQVHIGIGRDRAKALADAAHLHRQGHGFIQYLQALSAM